MAIRSIVQYDSNPEILRRPSTPVHNGASSVSGLVKDLKDTLLHHANGIGLAAPQIGVHERVIVVCFGAGNGT